MNDFKWQLLLFASPFVILTAGLLILTLSRNARSRNKSIPFAITYGAGATAWLAALIYIATVHDELAAHRVAFSAVYPLALGILGLATTFPNSALSSKAKRSLTLDGILGIIFVALILRTDLVVRAEDFRKGASGALPLLGTVYLGLVSIQLILAIIVFIYRYLREVRSRLYFNYIVLAFVISAMVAALTNLILPIRGTQSLAVVGPLMALLPFMVIVYALGITTLNDFGYVFAQLLRLIGRLVLGSLLVLLGYTLHREFGIDYYSSRWVLSMVVVMIAGITVSYMFGPTLWRKADQLLVYSGQSPEELRSKLLIGLSGETGLDANVGFVTKLMKEALGLYGAGVVLKTERTGYWQGGDFKLSEAGFNSISNYVQQRKVTVDSGLVRIDRHVDSLEIRKLVSQGQLYGVMPVHSTKDGTDGFYLLGTKFSQDIFSRQDTSILKMISEIADLSIERALLYDRIQAFNATLQNRIDVATRQLTRTNNRLRELDSTKDDFISMASHQLRTPLTSVKGYVSLVLDGDLGPINPGQRKTLEQAFRSSQQMVYLISDLLNLSRLNTGKFVIETAPTDLSVLVDEEVGQLKETAKSRNVNLVYDKPASFPDLMLDGTKIRQVAMNFMDNAIYYTPAGGTITVGLKETPTTVEYTVKDNGIGVPKDVQHKLFTKFYRAGNAQKARPDGTGLGLFMAKKVIVAQKGAIIFDSQEGKGSTFGFRFNKADHAVPKKSDKPAPAPNA